MRGLSYQEVIDCINPTIQAMFNENDRRGLSCDDKYMLEINTSIKFILDKLDILQDQFLSQERQSSRHIEGNYGEELLMIEIIIMNHLEQLP